MTKFSTFCLKTIFYFLLCVPVSLLAQSLFDTQEVPEVPCAPLISNIDGRTTRSLNGTWNAMIEPTVFSLNDLLHYAERNYKPRQGELVEVSIENGMTLQVPGDWNTQEERLFFYNGKVWYKRDIYIDKKPDQRYYLHFGAINYRAEIHVNGTLVATHVGGYTSFNCEVTDAIKSGENFVVIKVDNTLKSDDIPTTRTDWLNYGGITRDVNLVELPASFIETYKVQLAKGAKDKIEGWISVNGVKTGTARLQIADLGIDESLAISDGKAAFELEANPELWSPEKPKLYEVNLTFGTDEIKDQIGFRTIEVNGRTIELNGDPVFLRGISLHEEAIGAKGRASSYAEALELLQHAKELNCNYVRLAHYTHNHHMLRAADELGLLVWAEIPVYWNLEFANPEVMKKAQSRMDEMIIRDQKQGQHYILESWK